MKEGLHVMEEISFELGKLHSRTQIVAAHNHCSKQLTGDFRFTSPVGAHTLSSRMRLRKCLLLKLSVCLTVRNQFRAWNVSLITQFLNTTLWLAYIQVDSVFSVFLSLNIVKFLPPQHYTVKTPTVSGGMEKLFLFYQLWIALSDLLILWHNLSSWPAFCSSLVVLCTFLFLHYLSALKSKQFQTFWFLFISKFVYNFFLLFSYVFYICGMLLCCNNN